MKINLTLSFAPLIESGGEYWDYVRNRTIVYLAIYHLVMIGLLGLKEAAWEAVVTIIPLVVTPLFNHFILYRMGFPCRFQEILPPCGQDRQERQKRSGVPQIRANFEGRDPDKCRRGGGKH
eukprot:scaffold593_cov382-Prasinococcus_capsulatus_cf.AAC.8